ncbi:hypothetical protein R3P38DRAFT_2554164 [Favolaschia claudopus]|uniref:Uncharacterized protein n=1 Tax=Favolaschia claudopus TaxID=2862362 RepID=A0AAW0AF14_9AGAR
MSRRNPYPPNHSRPRTHTPSYPAENPMRKAYRELQELNHVGGKLVTWCHITQEWVEVPRPQRITNAGPVDVAASGFEKAYANKNPFFCPHAKSDGSKYNALVMRVGGRFEGSVADFYYARDHALPFQKSVIPLSKPKVLLTWSDREEYHRKVLSATLVCLLTLLLGAQDDDEASDAEEHSSPMPQASQSSTSSAASALSTTSTISRLVVEAQLTPSARSYALPATSRPLLPIPSWGGTVLAEGVRTKSFYSHCVADARKTPDFDIMNYILDIDFSGVLQEDPSVHPAWNMDEPHATLQVYDQRLYPRCLDRTFNFLNFMYKPLGQVIRQLNGALSVPYKDFANLVRCSVLCDGCLTLFSGYGYDAHLQDGKCTNRPDLRSVDEISIFEPEFKFRTFRNDETPKSVKETLDTAVGSALLEWNSRLGAPSDVWAMISTAVVTCTREVVRSGRVA